MIDLVTIMLKIFKVSHDSCNMCTCGLPDMPTLWHIRQTTYALQYIYKYIIFGIYIIYSFSFVGDFMQLTKSIVESQKLIIFYQTYQLGPMLGTGWSCWHNFERNRCLKVSSWFEHNTSILGRILEPHYNSLLIKK